MVGIFLNVPKDFNRSELPMRNLKRRSPFPKMQNPSEFDRPPPMHQKLHQKISPITLASETLCPLQFYP
jgi:hypothetical protein